MKVKVVSDLHLECCEFEHELPDLGGGEILILGGDILCARHFKTNGNFHKNYKKFLARCSDNFDTILYIAGNHEAYGYNYEGSWNVLKEQLSPRILLLEDDYVKIKDWVFIGSTFWTDFRNENALEMMEAAQCMNDYKTIRITPKYRKMNPDDTLGFHKKSKEYLTKRLEGEFKDQKVWVMTHHAPSYQSVHKIYRESGIANGAYVSDLDNFISTHSNIKVWSHGHTHTSFDYMIEGCRVICNPRGYYPLQMNPDFDPNFTMELD